MSRPPCTRTQAVARDTRMLAVVRSYIRVLWRLSMTALAVRRLSMNGSRTNTAKQILALGDRLKMLRIDARPVTTQMVNLQPVWYRSDHPFVDRTMRVSLAQTAIPVCRDITSPRPALGIRTAHQTGSPRLYATSARNARRARTLLGNTTICASTVSRGEHNVQPSVLSTIWNRTSRLT